MPIFADFIRDSIRRASARLAVLDANDGTEHTYAQLGQRMDQAAMALLDMGIQPGNHVAILQRNSHEWIRCQGALAKSGLVMIPISTYLSPREIAWILNHSEARAVLVTPDELPLLEPVRADIVECQPVLVVGGGGLRLPEWTKSMDDAFSAARPEDPWVEVAPDSADRIMYTSATTGLPKGVICPNEVMVGSVLALLANQLSDLTEDSRFLAATPLTHMANPFFWPFFSRGASAVILKRYTPERFCELVSNHAVTHTVLAPTMIAMLVEYLEQHPEAAARLRSGSLRAVWYAGSPIPPSVARDAERHLGPILNQQYGMTELFATHPAMAVTQLTSAWHSRKPGSCGRPTIGSVVRVVDDADAPVGPHVVGEVVVRCNGRVAGYWRHPSPEDGAFRNGWLHTGDVGYFDEDGFLYLKSRKNDMIISGGLNIYPAEVENVLLTHPAVSSCAVVGVPDPMWVEVPVAVIVRKSPGEVREEELIEYARARIAHFKAPKRVVFVDAMPISSAGKLLRRKLREELMHKIGHRAAP